MLDKNHAGWRVAEDAVAGINEALTGISELPLAKAIHQANIEVQVPDAYSDNLVSFVSLVLESEIFDSQPGPCVVIRERTGEIVITGNVKIGPVAVTHKNVTINVGNAVIGDRFVPVDVGKTHEAELKALTEALNGIHVPSEDIIDIIKGLDRAGELQGKLIIE